MELFNRFFDPAGSWEMLSRYAHILSGITWIGLLYFFNFVNARLFLEGGYLETLLTAARFYRAQLKDAPAAIDYLKRRGIDQATVERFGLGDHLDAQRVPEIDRRPHDSQVLVVCVQISSQRTKDSAEMRALC